MLNYEKHLINDHFIITDISIKLSSVREMLNGEVNIRNGFLGFCQDRIQGH